MRVALFSYTCLRTDTEEEWVLPNVRGVTCEGLPVAVYENAMHGGIEIPVNGVQATYTRGFLYLKGLA